MIGTKNIRPVVLFLFLTLNLTLLLSISSGGLAQTETPEPPPVPVWETSPPYPTNVVDEAKPATALGTVRTFSAVADAEVRQANAATNFGIEPTFRAGYDNYVDNGLISRALIRFDTSTYLPPNTTIHSATMKLYFTGYCDLQTTAYQAYRITDDWFEMSVNWNNQPGIGEAYGSQSIPSSPSWGYVDFNVTSLVQKWVNGVSPENGVMVRGPEAPPYDCAYRQFLSKGGGGFTAAPVLVVDYTLPATALSVSQASIDIFHECGTALPAPVVIGLASNDNTLRNWSGNAGSASWLQMSKSSGKVSRVFSDQIEITVSETGNCPATSNGQIQVTAPGLSNPSQTIEVTLHEVEELSRVYLPLVAKNLGGATYVGALRETAVTQPTAPLDRIVLLIGVGDYESMAAPTTYEILRPGAPGDDLGSPVMTDFSAIQDLFQQGLEPCKPARPEAVPYRYTIISLPENLATKANIDYALQWIDEREDANTEVIIFFSGHGGPLPDLAPFDEGDSNDEMLGPYDIDWVTGPPYFSNQLLDDTFANQLLALETQHLAVIMDACNSGGMEIANANRSVMAASLESQLSWQSDALEHGVFTHFILEATLDPANDTNGNGWFSMQELYNYAAPRVAQYVDLNTSSQQNPVFDQTSSFDLFPVSGATCLIP